MLLSDNIPPKQMSIEFSIAGNTIQFKVSQENYHLVNPIILQILIQTINKIFTHPIFLDSLHRKLYNRRI